MAVKPNLALIPSGVKASKVYSVLPTDGTGDFDFSRSGSATRINKDGLIETVASNVPRLNYPLIDGVVQGCPSLLLEPQRSNLVTYSEDFTDASWIKLGAGVGSQAVVTQNYSISPNGTQNATRLQCNLNGGTTASDQSLIYFIPSGSSNSYTNSIYVKGVSGQTFAIGRDLNNNKTVLTDGSWQRVDFTYVNTPIIFIGSRGTTGSDNVLDLEIWGAQLEAGSYPTSYIPTNGSTVTRVAETATGAGDASTFNDSEGVLMAEISALADDGTARVITINDGGSSDYIGLRYHTVSNTVRFLIKSGGTVNFDYFITLPSTEEYNKIAIKYDNTNVYLWANGFEYFQFSPITTPIGLSTLDFDDSVGGDDFYGNTKQIQYFNTALTDAELEKLTSYDSFRDMAIAGQYKTY